MLPPGRVYLLLALTVGSLPPDTQATEDCDSDGPKDCSFGSLCTWTGDADLDELEGDKVCVFSLTSDTTAQTLESRTACSTEGRNHCLIFWYRFSENDRGDLNVIVQHVGSNEAVSETLWTISSSRYWDRGRVPLNTNSSFRVVFEARRFDGQNSSLSVYLDLVRYVKRSCIFHPVAARPITTTASAVPTEVTSTTAMTEIRMSDTTTRRSSESKCETPTCVSQASTTQAADKTGPFLQEPAPEDMTDSYDVAMCIVIISVTIIVICIVVFVVLKRKQVAFCDKNLQGTTPTDKACIEKGCTGSGFLTPMGGVQTGSLNSPTAADNHTRDPTERTKIPIQFSDDYDIVIHDGVNETSPSAPSEGPVYSEPAQGDHFGNDRSIRTDNPYDRVGGRLHSEHPGDYDRIGSRGCRGRGVIDGSSGTEGAEGGRNEYDVLCNRTAGDNVTVHIYDRGLDKANDETMTNGDCYSHLNLHTHNQKKKKPISATVKKTATKDKSAERKWTGAYCNVDLRPNMEVSKTPSELHPAHSDTDHGRSYAGDDKPPRNDARKDKSQGEGRCHRNTPSKSGGLVQGPQEDDYRALDWTPECRRPQDHGGGLSEVYSRLNGGEDRALYSGLRHEEKGEVIDQDYSHVGPLDGV